jgi:predicted transcriptional regulator
VKNLTRRRKLGSKLLKAIASSLRLNILNLLSDRGPLAYTEIMNSLKLSPSRDAGRFAYHLKTLLSMDLIEPDATSKKYSL